MLPAVRTAAGSAGLDAIVAQPADALLAFDFDGTLAPIVPDPEAARADPRVVPLLARLAPKFGTLAIITGRPAAVAVDYAGLAGSAVAAVADRLAGLIVLGHYGLERWDAATGEVTSPGPPPGLALVRDEIGAVLAAAGAPPGTYLEDKGSALAVHVRRTPDPAEASRRLAGPLRVLAERHGLHLEPGRMVVELRGGETDKGSALIALVRERGARSVLFAGDDLGDVAAFAAVERLRGEGLAGVTVCSGSAEVAELADRADVVVDGPDGVMRLLGALADAVD